MIIRRTLVNALGACTLIGPRAVPAQQRTWRLGFLSGASAQGAGGEVAAILLAALNQLGYVQGRNLEWHERYADTDFPRLDAMAADLVRVPVDAILTQTSPAALAAKRATRTVPVVVVASGDLVGAGVVDSLARPGGNVTGLSFLGTELALKQMQLLKELVPGMRRLAFVAVAGVQPEVLFFREMQARAPTLGLGMVMLPIRPEQGFADVFGEIARERVDAVLLASSVINRVDWKDAATLAQRARIPTMFANHEGVASGGLVSYGIDRAEFYSRAASFVDRILKGSRPADLPIEQPTKFKLMVNLRTVKALGITIPQSLLLRADEVIQ